MASEANWIDPPFRRRAFVAAGSELIPIYDIKAEKMAELKAKIEFDLKLKQFEEIADKVACFKCKVIPRKGPIYQIFETKEDKDGDELGKITCDDCTWMSSYVKGHHGTKCKRNKILEAMLFVLPTSCKYRKNGCKFVQDLNEIECHENACDFRDVSCPSRKCRQTIAFVNLKSHLESECDGKPFESGLHKVIERDSAFFVKIKNWEKFDAETFVLKKHGKIFYLQMTKRYDNLTGFIQVNMR